MDNDLISCKALLEELKEWYSEAKQREDANYERETFLRQAFRGWTSTY